MKPIFIGGTGSSGTTILRRILASHPLIVSIPLELRIIVDPDGTLDLINAITDFWSPYTFDKAFYRFKRLLELGNSGSYFKKGFAEVLRRLGICPPPYSSLAWGRWFGKNYLKERIKKLENALRIETTNSIWIGSEPWRKVKMYHVAPFPKKEAYKIMSDFFRDLYKKRGEIENKHEATHWVEDTPENLLRFKELKELFPDAKFIHIYRDPRDVVASYRRQRWGRGSIEVITKRVKSILSKWLEIKKELPEDIYLEVCIERLGTSPEKEFERIFNFLRIPAGGDISLLNISKIHVGRWKSELSSKEKSVVIHSFKSLLEIYGYK